MSSARLTYQSTNLSADAFFIAGMNVPDAFIGIELNGRFYAVTSALELGNFKKQSRCDEVFSLDDFSGVIPSGLPQQLQIAHVIKLVLKKLGVRSVTIGSEAPVALYRNLSGIMSVKVANGALFPERAIKDIQQQKQIAKANKGCAAAIAWVGQQIAASRVVKNKLTQNGKSLTSESLRFGAQKVLLENGLAAADDIIIAGGKQGCDPHCIGSGPLKAGELIIVDIFSSLSKSGYWGDMTRTFIKGTPTPAQVALVEAVAKAQKGAIKSIKPGINGKSIHTAITKAFESSGYKTERRDSSYVGFFHGTGHSLGLECHDLGEHGKRISRIPSKLIEGEVYTVEPGLYYPEIGGCRIEDNGVVTDDGFKLLSKLGYDWIL